jgi:hypothetical protein
MVNIQNKVLFKAFGLNINSEIFLSELPIMDVRKDLIDIEISIKNLKSKWAELNIPNDEFVVRENEVMFQIPDIAIFSIRDGSKITVSPLDDYDVDTARLYLLGTCMGAILLQRKILPLHGSAVVIDGKAYGFVGDSGAGKSTLASAFLKNGYQLLTDDVIAIHLSEEEVPIVTPSYPQQKLWQESLNEFGMGNHQYRPLLARETKYAVPIGLNFTAESAPLAGVFELVKTEGGQLEILPIQGLERLRTLLYHTYRHFIISPSGLMEWHFNMITRIVNKIDMFQLCRPISRFTAHDLPPLILKTLRNEDRS